MFKIWMRWFATSLLIALACSAAAQPAPTVDATLASRPETVVWGFITADLPPALTIIVGPNHHDRYRLAPGSSWQGGSGSVLCERRHSERSGAAGRAVCLGELTRNPLGGRMRSHAEPQYLPAGMLQNQKSIQQPERVRGDHEQIHRRDAVRCSGARSESGSKHFLHLMASLPMSYGRAMMKVYATAAARSDGQGHERGDQ